MHSVAMTEDGEVYGWGRNEQGQLGDPTNVALPEPVLLPGTDGRTIIGICCGPSQVRAVSGIYERVGLDSSKNLICVSSNE